MRTYHVYIMANRRRRLYIGFTGDLSYRVQQHKRGVHVGGFTRRYNHDRLVYYEATRDPLAGIAREKQLKGWTREKKLQLIESVNPEWRDLGLEGRR